VQFSASAFIGPIIGPFIGGFLSTSSKYGWRWIFWIIMALSGLVTVVVFFLLPGQSLRHTAPLPASSL
jgi:DHA1 family multidrug resistance protein-like MFS transporter